MSYKTGLYAWTFVSLLMLAASIFAAVTMDGRPNDRAFVLVWAFGSGWSLSLLVHVGFFDLHNMRKKRGDE